MARGTATHSGEELEVAFSASGVPADYGVDRSPTWTDWGDIEIEELTILGHKVDPKTCRPSLWQRSANLPMDWNLKKRGPTMIETGKIAPSVELVAFVEDTGGVAAATILIEGGAPVRALTAMAMRAVASQHPHLSGKPILALRYNVRAQTRVAS